MSYLSDTILISLLVLPTCSWLLGTSYTLPKQYRIPLFVLVLSVTAAAPFIDKVPNVYDHFGIPVNAPSDVLNMAYKRAAFQVANEHPSLKEQVDRMYHLVRGNNRYVYSQSGDHMIRMNTAVVDTWVVVCHAVAVCFLLGALAALTVTTPSSEVTFLYRGYLVLVMCLELYARLLDDSILEIFHQHYLTFEIIQLLQRLFPAVCSTCLLLGHIAGFQPEQDRLLSRVKRILAVNSDLKKAIIDPTTEPFKLPPDTQSAKPTDLGALLNTTIAIILLVATIFYR